ncbi:phage tail protein, partial [Salmonella enterica subsp. enterica serovar Infantis]
DAITSSVAEATYDSAETLVIQARCTLQTSAPDVSQLADADITRSL